MRVRPQTASALRSLAADEPLEILVRGDCMAPLLQSGHRISVARGRVYLPGDIVAFRREDDRLLVHRVLGYSLSRRGLRLMAKGDRLAREDEPVSLECVVGRVVGLDGCSLAPSAGERWRALLLFLSVSARRSMRPWASATTS